MEFIYKCFCIKTLNKVIVEELTESYEMNQDNQDEILLNHLFPYFLRHCGGKTVSINTFIYTLNLVYKIPCN